MLNHKTLLFASALSTVTPIAHSGTLTTAVVAGATTAIVMNNGMTSPALGNKKTLAPTTQGIQTNCQAIIDGYTMSYKASIETLNKHRNEQQMPDTQFFPQFQLLQSNYSNDLQNTLANVPACTTGIAISTCNTFVGAYSQNFKHITETLLRTPNSHNQEYIDHHNKVFQQRMKHIVVHPICANEVPVKKQERK